MSPEKFSVDKIGTGHIHQTYKLNGKISYILQRINKSVFKQPEVIASNLRFASEYLKEKFPNYNFLRSIATIDGMEMAYDADGFPWRLFLFQENTITIDKVDTPEEAFRAAAGFGQLTSHLNNIDIGKFSETIPRFHDLSLRYQQFLDARSQVSMERRRSADGCIAACEQLYSLVEMYEKLIGSESLRLRVTHNDTKINNILFDEVSKEVVSVIDLDTLMPGYFIYDLGDMVRTFVSPVTEEEADYEKSVFRKEIYDSVLEGYLSEMGEVMSSDEKNAIPFAGKMMTFIMALRFLTDYLNGDIYYHTMYSGQNLTRAGNQLRFLELLVKHT
ncbi:aminoglycoside phosphotransferase family protein [soil metagenome]